MCVIFFFENIEICHVYNCGSSRVGITRMGILWLIHHHGSILSFQILNGYRQSLISGDTRKYFIRLLQFSVHSPRIRDFLEINILLWIKSDILLCRSENFLMFWVHKLLHFLEFHEHKMWGLCLFECWRCHKQWTRPVFYHFLICFIFTPQTRPDNHIRNGLLRTLVSQTIKILHVAKHNFNWWFAKSVSIFASNIGRVWQVMLQDAIPPSHLSHRIQCSQTMSSLSTMFR